MEKLWLIAKSNMKKRKGNLVTLFTLVVIVVVLMYASLNVLSSVGQFLIERNEAQNGAHVMMITTPNYKEEMLDIVQNTAHFKAVEIGERLLSTASGDIINVTIGESSKESMQFQWSRMAQKHEISNCEIIDQAEQMEENAIVLPMYLKVSKGYRTGDEIEIKIDQMTKKFKVYGFIEDALFAVPSNLPIYSCQTTDTMYEQIEKEGSIEKQYQYNIVLDSVDFAQDYEGTVTKQVSEKMIQPDFAVTYILNLDATVTSITMMIHIIMVIISIFAVMMVVIVVIVIRFNLMMFLEENIANIGIMEAQGYTIKQLRAAMLVEYAGITIVGAVVGLVIAVLASTWIAQVVSTSIGYQWTPSIHIALGCGVAGVVLFFVYLIVTTTAGRLKKITTLDALRGGIQTHNFKKNPLSLEKTRGELNTVMGLKNLLFHRKQNLSVCVIVTLLSFASVLSLMIYYNFVGDDITFRTIVGIENNDIEVTPSQKEETILKSLLAEFEKQEDIDHGMLYGSQLIKIYSDTDELAVETDVYSDFSALEINTVCEGREPIYENELVVTTVIANRFHLRIGDSIQARVGETEKSYIICGISQQMSNMGVRCHMSKEGAMRLNPKFTYQVINLYVSEEVNEVQKVVERMRDNYQTREDLTFSNQDETFKNVIGSLSQAVILMCAVFVIITMLVVMLIIVLIMGMKVVRERKSIGIKKALGFTTKQIVWQMVMSFAPMITVGTLIGGGLGVLSINQIFVMSLSFCQIQNVALKTSPAIVFGAMIFISVLAFGVSALIASKARKIEPYTMLIGE